MTINTKVNSKHIRAFHNLLHNWMDIIEKYISYNEFEDNPWWYNERATISTLAAAAWATEGIALEEYSTEKGKKGRPWKGRCDLFLGLKTKIFACEAKQAWCPISRHAKNSIINVRNTLKIACDDARKLDKQEGQRLGICFAVPYLPQKEKKYMEEQIKSWCKKLEEIDCDAYAWVFPKKVRYLTASSKGYFHPGVAVVIREVYRKT